MVKVIPRCSACGCVLTINDHVSEVRYHLRRMFGDQFPWFADEVCRRVFCSTQCGSDWLHAEVERRRIIHCRRRREALEAQGQGSLFV